MNVPPLVVTVHDGISVVRDDLVLGGTKARVVPALMAGTPEWVYAGPSQGYAQVALAIGARVCGCAATFFTPARNQLAPLTQLAAALGLRVVQVPAGRLSVLNARARDYCTMTGATPVPLGLAFDGMEPAVAALAATLDPPAEVWVAAGSGLLARALAAAWPDAQLHAVQVGGHPTLPPGARRWLAPEAFADPAGGPLPPFPSVRSYDAKAWRFVAEHAQPGALFWNVAGDPPSLDRALQLIEAGTLDLREPACPDRR